MDGHRAGRDRSRGLHAHTIRKVEGGFPHSEIPGSKLVRSSPRLIAAYHVLHRLSAPRHPPDALTTLDCSYDRCPPGKRPDTIQERPVFDPFGSKTILLAKHIRRSWLRARAGSRELGCPACRICCLFTISNIRAAHPKGRARTSFDIPEKIIGDRRSHPSKNDGGACRDRTDDLKLAKLPLSQLS